MPSVPLPPQVPIERASWNTDFNPGGIGQGAGAVGHIENPLSAGMGIAGQQAQQALQGAQTANTVNEMQQRQRGMQLSMLSGILNEPDPDKQKQLIQNIVPLANKLNPSYQIDPNIDVGTVRALVQSQVTPEEQAKNALMQSMYGMKAVSIGHDPATGALVRMNKMTGQVSPLNPQEEMQYNANPMAFEASQNQSGIFPSGQNGAFNAPQMTNQNQPAQPQQPAAPPAFGFPASSYITNPNALKLEQKNAAAFEQNRGQRDILADQAEQKLDELKPDIEAVKGGPDWWTQAGFMGAHLVPGGTNQLNKATEADAETKDLANTLSQMATQPGSRATKIALQTLLSSKPDPYNQTPEANKKLMTNTRVAINQYRLETAFLDAYKDANPQHVIDDRAYNLFDALSKQFPLATIDKDGKPTFNQENVEGFKAAIPDALSNPTKYMKTSPPNTAVNQANAALPQKQPNTPQYKTVEDVGADLQAGKITPAAAQGYWAAMGVK